MLRVNFIRVEKIIPQLNTCLRVHHVGFSLGSNLIYLTAACVSFIGFVPLRSELETDLIRGARHAVLGFSSQCSEFVL